jgi:hypothetical protein
VRKDIAKNKKVISRRPFWERRKDAEMRKKNYQGRCQKQKMKKCKDVVK